ncbi:hypothetical protein LZ554_006248 [Drepanopeziza brunnea f. sp. 'monogermtubi']|nr:hypothetical protein LZ554_006248 [Drepanopeziza brunnea f. sp. 'monogermtubi']
MADEVQLESQSSIDSFFRRANLTSKHQAECYDLLAKLYPGKPISPAPCQGYCSLTIMVGDDAVLQFRPCNYQFDLRMTSAAREVYGTCAPETKYITTLQSGLLVYSMERIQGVSLMHMRASKAVPDDANHYRARLCRDFAAFLTKSWSRNALAKTALGTVGRSIRARMRMLAAKLPRRFRPTARRIFENLYHVEALPWVITHGDIVAANIMVDPSSGRLTGLVDWAEAETLPFGICLYGLEEMLGEMTPTGFRFCRDAEYLRTVFWDELKRSIPELGHNHVLEAVKLARDLGVLLWHGIAFDDGAIDRVVQQGRDIEEIHRLDAFLDISVLPAIGTASKL